MLLHIWIACIKEDIFAYVKSHIVDTIVLEISDKLKIKHVLNFALNTLD